jgi:hypothetical protein
MTLGRTPSLGWPPPPYRLTAGTIPELLDHDGYVVLPNPPRQRTRLLVEWLVREQAARRLAVRHVRDQSGHHALLVCDRDAWEAP